jgi:hypothetical protein
MCGKIKTKQSRCLVIKYCPYHLHIKDSKSSLLLGGAGNPSVVGMMICLCPSQSSCTPQPEQTFHFTAMTLTLSCLKTFRVSSHVLWSKVRIPGLGRQKHGNLSSTDFCSLLPVSGPLHRTICYSPGNIRHFHAGPLTPIALVLSPPPCRIPTPTHFWHSSVRAKFSLSSPTAHLCSYGTS